MGGKHIINTMKNKTNIDSITSPAPLKDKLSEASIVDRQKFKYPSINGLNMKA
jgi:hypothetical protein